MSGAEIALERAVLAALRGDAAVKGFLGDPPRVFDADVARPAYPFLEIVRHQSEAIDGQDAPARNHVLDLGILTSQGGRDEVKEALAAVRTVVEAGALAPEGYRCVLVVVKLADVVRASVHHWRALLRVRVIMEPE